ncbi:MAG TPA: SigB/SigF/SigG family RNA polymerase sigma factor [Solirubrobacteraceae bacterium]
MACPPTPSVTVSSGELFNRWYEGHDVRARDALIERFLPLARKLARRYSGNNEPYDDLVQVASLGLVKAVERFDPTRGFAFTSFAVPTIVGELKRYFRDTAWALHVDRSAQELVRRISDARREVTLQQGRSPTVQELAEYLECTEEEVLDGLLTGEAFDTVSLDAPRGGGGGGGDDEADNRLEALGGDDGRLDLIDDQATVFAAAQRLPERERRILYLRFGEDLTQAEIARRIGVSQMQVSRLLRKSVKRLRELTQ